MIRIKLVPNSIPNAEGEWKTVPVDLPEHADWKETDRLVEAFVPEGYHIVAVERVNVLTTPHENVSPEPQ